MTYTIKTPNPLYKGITEGVPFSKGIGQTDNKNVRNVLVNDYKYEDITDYSVLEESAGKIGGTTEDSGKEIANELTIAQLKDTDGIDIENLTVPQLKSLAKELNLSNYSEMTKPELIELINNA